MARVSGLDEFDWDSIVLHFPTAEEEERIKRFQVHRNYLLNIAMFLNDRYPRDVAPGVLAEQRALPGFRRIQRRMVNAEADIRRFLNIAWASELQLRLPELGERGFLRYSNAWTPVHAYYAVYMSMQAWFASMGMLKLVDDHTSTLRTIANHVQRGVFPVPWTVTVDGCPQLHECSFAGLPEGIDSTTHVELLENPYLETFWPRLCKMLETTRKIRLERNLTEWKAQNNRKAMRKDEKRLVASRLLPTTIFDFFWRLRVRANYRRTWPPFPNHQVDAGDLGQHGHVIRGQVVPNYGSRQWTWKGAPVGEDEGLFNPFAVRYDERTEERHYEGGRRSLGTWTAALKTYIEAISPAGDRLGAVATIDDLLWEPDPGATVHLQEPIRQGRVQSVEFQITGEGISSIVTIEDSQREEVPSFSETDIDTG